MVDAMKLKSDASWTDMAHTSISQTYSELAVRLQLINEMVKETGANWTRFMRTKDRWMANCVIGDDDSGIDYFKLR